MRWRQPPSLPAFVAYLLASLLLGECYPLSRYPMYALSGYEQGTALVFLADGEPVPDLSGFVAFAGFEPDALRYPERHAASQEYLLDAVRHQITVRSVEAPPSGAPVRLEIGYQLAEATDEGPRVVAPFIPLAEGRAWSRD